MYVSLKYLQYEDKQTNSTLYHSFSNPIKLYIVKYFN